MGSSLKREEVTASSSPAAVGPNPHPNYVGQIQQLYYSGVYLIDMAWSGQLASTNVTAKFGTREQNIHFH